jgi:predicted TIM-barrel fold metal-dependent hydrolase
MANRRRVVGYDVEEQLLEPARVRIAAMDAAGIDLQVLSLTVPGCQVLEAEQSKEVAREANDALFQMTQEYPGRFLGFAAIPTPDPEGAARELERTVNSLGFKGAMVSGHTNGLFLDDKRFWPIFECAQALDVPICIHPSFPHPALLKAYFTGYEELIAAPWGFAIDASNHFLRILFSGVFDTFPNLKIILGHLGEGLPFGLDRLNQHTQYYAERIGLKRRPIEYMRENVVVTCSGNFYLPALICTVMALGIDNVLFSVDWPYESNIAATEFLKCIPFAVSDLEKIAYRNTERVLRL